MAEENTLNIDIDAVADEVINQVDEASYKDFYEDISKINKYIQDLNMAEKVSPIQNVNINNTDYLNILYKNIFKTLMELRQELTGETMKFLVLYWKNDKDRQSFDLTRAQIYETSNIEAAIGLFNENELKSTRSPAGQKYGKDWHLNKNLTNILHTVANSWLKNTFSIKTYITSTGTQQSLVVYQNANGNTWQKNRGQMAEPVLMTVLDIAMAGQKGHSPSFQNNFMAHLTSGGGGSIGAFVKGDYTTRQRIDGILTTLQYSFKINNASLIDISYLKKTLKEIKDGLDFIVSGKTRTGKKKIRDQLLDIHNKAGKRAFNQKIQEITQMLKNLQKENKS